jgi:hypothetical protein
VVPSADGTTDFSVLQNQLRGKSDKIVMVAFDLLYLNGYDLRRLPLVERKALLKKLIAKTDIQFSETFEVDGREMFKHACAIGIEGVVSKVRDSRYASGRGNDWVKKTCAQRETLPIRSGTTRLTMSTGMARPIPALEPDGDRIAVVTPISRPAESSKGPPELPGLIAVSRGELEADLSAVAAPIRAASPEAQSALALVTSSERFELLNIDVLSRLVVNGAGEIGEILTAT